MRLGALLVCTSLGVRAACLPVAGEEIRAADLAAALPAFSALEPSLVIGHSPAPGARRVFRVAELLRLASAYHLAAAPLEDVCFEWPLSPLSDERILAALHAATGNVGARIDILDRSRFAVPPGELVFPRQGLSAASGSDRTLLYWRGRIRYSASRSVPVWVKVRISSATTRVVAQSALAAGQAIVAERLELVPIEGSPLDSAYATSIVQVAGRIPRAAIPAGAAIQLSLLSAAPEIAAGESVQVEVRKGAMRVLVEARAEQPARTGEMVALVNPESGKRYRARVESKGRASVNLGAKEESHASHP